MIIVFLIDTSASMNQRVYHGGHPRFIDIAKGAVETFVKVCILLLVNYYLKNDTLYFVHFEHYDIPSNK